MPVFKREHSFNLQNLRERLLFDYGIRTIRYFQEGKGLILSLIMTEFRNFIDQGEPALYVKLDYPVIFQSDRILVRSENEEEANKFIDDLIVKFELAYVSESLEELIKKQEDTHLEFKSTLRYDVENKLKDVTPPEKIRSILENETLTAICAFLNTDGGILIIGISDNKKIIGLSHDLKTFTKKQDTDEFELHLTNLIWSKIGKLFLRFITISFHKIEDEIMCKILVRASDEPAFFKEGEHQFFIRVGNSTRPLSMKEASEYIRKKWRAI